MNGFKGYRSTIPYFVIKTPTLFPSHNNKVILKPLLQAMSPQTFNSLKCHGLFYFNYYNRM